MDTLFLWSPPNCVDDLLALPLEMMLVSRVEATLLSPPFAPQGGAAGDHFIVPRTLFRMASSAIHIRLSSIAGFCPIYSGLCNIGGEYEIKEFHPPQN